MIDFPKNNDPFDLMLDAYVGESSELFDKLSKDLPEFQETDNEVELASQAMRETAFAYLCMDYMRIVAGYAEHEDFPLVCEEMGFEESKDAFFYLMGKEGVEWDMSESSLYGYSPFVSMLESLMYQYISWWKKDVIVPDEFIESIFGDDPPTGIDAWGSSQSFFNS